MDLASAIISAVGLVFAAIAAVAAMQTVALTRLTLVEQRLADVHETIVAVMAAANHAQPPLGTEMTEHDQRFDDAVHELTRRTAGSLGGVSDAVWEPIGKIINDKNIWNKPTHAMSLAMEAQRALMTEREQVLQPRGVLKLLRRLGP
jgi:hypothetical protein